MMLAVASPATAAPNPRSAPAALARVDGSLDEGRAQPFDVVQLPHGATARPDGRRGEDRVRDLGGQPATGPSYAPAAAVGDRRERPQPQDQQGHRAHQRQPQNRVQQHSTSQAPINKGMSTASGATPCATQVFTEDRSFVARATATPRTHAVLAEVATHQPYADLVDMLWLEAGSDTTRSAIRSRPTTTAAASRIARSSPRCVDVVRSSERTTSRTPSPATNACPSPTLTRTVRWRRSRTAPQRWEAGGVLRPRPVHRHGCSAAADRATAAGTTPATGRRAPRGRGPARPGLRVPPVWRAATTSALRRQRRR